MACASYRPVGGRGGRSSRALTATVHATPSESADPAARPGRLRDAAKRAGVEPCPFADEDATPRADGAK